MLSLAWNEGTKLHLIDMFDRQLLNLLPREERGMLHGVAGGGLPLVDPASRCPGLKGPQEQQLLNGEGSSVFPWAPQVLGSEAF